MRDEFVEMLQATDKVRGLVGLDIGKLHVMRVAGINGTYYECKCACGKTRLLKRWALRNGLCTSCGHCKEKRKSVNTVQTGYLEKGY